jgi:hypothetical protein
MMQRSTRPTHVFLCARDLTPGGTVLPATTAVRGEVHVIVDGLDRVDTGALAGLLHVYASLLSRGATTVRFLVGARAAAELGRIGLEGLLFVPPAVPALLAA